MSQRTITRILGKIQWALLVPSFAILMGPDCPTGDLDGDGYTIDQGDCDDADPDIHPNAPEVCDGIDNDCNGAADDISATEWYPDMDGDGFGGTDPILGGCDQPVGYVANAGDCNDADPDINPAMPELCDGVDDNCNKLVDEGFMYAEDIPGNLVDLDGDGFGAAASADVTCVPVDLVAASRGDCNDTDDSVYPGALDVAGDGIDQDCGGTDSPEPHVGLDTTSQGSIAAAIAAAAPGVTIWVAPGIYMERDLDFAGKALTLASTHFADATIIDAGETGSVFKFISGETTTSVLDGFTLTGGNADSGGALFLDSSSPTIKECILLGNLAFLKGGAAYLIRSQAQFIHCRFLTNAVVDPLGHGGGIYLSESNAVFSGCEFNTNVAQSGGAIYMSYSNPTVDNSVFTANAASTGGAVYSFYSTATVTNSLFEENQAEADGGAVYLYSKRPIFWNSLLIANQAQRGSAFYLYYSSPTMGNLVMAGNAAAQTGGSLELIGAQSKPAIFSSVMAYNTGYNLYLDSSAGLPVPQVTYSDLYSPDGAMNHNLPSLDPTNMVDEPMFLSYGPEGMPLDYHLSLASPLVDAAHYSYIDADGSPADIGIYGAIRGNRWDLDGDGYVDYFWPGTLSDAPRGLDPDNYDANDRDPITH